MKHARDFGIRNVAHIVSYFHFKNEYAGACHENVPKQIPEKHRILICSLSFSIVFSAELLDYEQYFMALTATTVLPYVKYVGTTWM